VKPPGADGLGVFYCKRHAAEGTFDDQVDFGAVPGSIVIAVKTLPGRMQAAYQLFDDRAFLGAAHLRVDG